MLNWLSPHLTLALPLIVLAGALPWRRYYESALTLNIAAFVLGLTLSALCLTGVAQDSWLEPLWQNVPAYAKVISLLVTFLGAVLVQFSRNYLAGEHGQRSYLSHLQLTLGAVLLVVLSNHLAVVIVGWVAISLGLHRLLMFYPDRPRAVLAAHKKFLLARLAEITLLSAGILLHVEYGTWQLDLLREAIVAQPPAIAGQTAAVLIALVALIKCAQLPVHGWLIQIVEAPTPVSALLHAGVINLGGVLLMIFAPLIAAVPAAQWLILIVAGLTTVVAALVMSVEISVKARLAWSTSAQMGLMLVECALGLYQLALLHLLAHASYKAYVFLSAGSAVHRHTFIGHAPVRRSLGQWLSSVLLALGLTSGAALLFSDPVGLSPWLLLTALLTLLFVETAARGGSRAVFAAGGLALVLMVAFSLQKLAIGEVISPQLGAPLAGMDLWISALILVLMGLFELLNRGGSHPFAVHLRALLFAGFYIDEGITRATLTLWPITKNSPERNENPTQHHHTQATQELR